MKTHSCGDSALSCIDCQAQICPSCMEQCPVGNRCRKCSGRFTSHLTKLPMPIMLRTAAGAVVVGFAFGCFYQFFQGGFYIWFLVYFLGCLLGKGLHKLASYKLGKRVLATMIVGVIAGALLSPAQGEMLGHPSNSSFMGVKVDKQSIIEQAPAIARHRFSTFEQAFRDKAPQDTFAVQAPFEDSGAVEHIWFKVTKIDGSDIKGLLTSEPKKLSNLKEGSEVSTKVDKIDDWMYTHNGQDIGYFGMDPDERVRKYGDDDAWMTQGWIWINLAIMLAGVISPVLAIRLKNG